MNYKFLFFFFFFLPFLKAQDYRVLESTPAKLKIELNFSGKYTVADTIINNSRFNIIRGESSLYGEIGKPWLPSNSVSLGLPFNSEPVVTIVSAEKEVYKNKVMLPFPEDEPGSAIDKMPVFDQAAYSRNSLYPAEVAQLSNSFFMRYIRGVELIINPFQYNPVSRELIFNRKIIAEIYYNSKGGLPSVKIDDPMTEEFIRTNLINASDALNWAGKPQQMALQKTEEYWYNPQKDYYKLFLKNEGLYRITYEYLSSAGVNLMNTPVNDIELLNYGKHIPVYVVDSDNNALFNEGDYFEFIGLPPPSTPYSKQNIYNTSNIYWLSLQGNSAGIFYRNKSAFPENWEYTSQASLETLHFEEELLYERLGLAPDDKRDYWYWATADARGGSPVLRFEGHFNGFDNFASDSHYVTVRVKMHGMTDISSCPADHRANIYINEKMIGSIEWDGQTEVLFEKKFYVSEDSINIYPEGNIIRVETPGTECGSNDEIRINWYEFDFWRFNRTGSSYAFNSNPGIYSKTRFWTWLWENGDVKIFVPQRAEKLTDYVFAAGQNNTIVFCDSVNEPTRYYMFADSYTVMFPDSIIRDIPSDYRSASNAADYIIITHNAFMITAGKLKEFREKNFPDSSITNPRIFIADVNEIYDEFSYGMLDPFALKDFVKYAFNNWQQPAPAYVVLLGDMSWDYRKIFAKSRPNFVPSIPVHMSVKPQLVYGQAVSDNNMVSISGNDSIPDLAIGRLSIETLEDGDILLNKLMNYPGDNGKDWKQNVLLISSGKDAIDEGILGFNYENMYLENEYIKPAGIHTTKVFRFINLPEYEPFKGSGPEIRNGFNEGTVLANYYGHGGGNVWDFVFTNDDIYLLNNQARLPVITSTTCYTAHFDNQDVFGEQFIKVPGKGAIGFISSTGLTLWNAGNNFNKQVYKQIFSNRVYNIGKAMLYGYKEYPVQIKQFEVQLSSFVLLGDPVMKLALPEKPDFRITPSDISITPRYPIVDEPVSVTVKINNLGTVFSDSVTVFLFAESSDTSYQVGTARLGSFGDADSIIFNWNPASGGMYELTAEVNEDGVIAEEDNSDNSASALFAVFNISEPNIIHPINGYNTLDNFVKFVLSDIAYYAGKQSYYTIEIDTTINFTSPLFKQEMLSPSEGMLEWRSPDLVPGVYFWRTRTFDGENYGNWTPVRGFITGTVNSKGFSSSGKLLKIFDTYNANYSELSHGIVLNKELLPPKPDSTRFIEDIKFPTTGIENLGLTTITTDGTYIYFANIAYYSYSNNIEGRTRIHKVGTGNNGSEKGKYYGELEAFYESITNQLFYHSDGYLYSATNDPHKLLRIDPKTGSSDSLNIEQGLLDYESARVKKGSFYITSDGKYVYNLTIKDSLGNNKYVLRTFDPANNWSLVRSDMVLTGSSYITGFTGFFVADGYLYPMEYYNSNFIRKIRLLDGLFEEEWFLYEPFRSYYAICYDWTNSEVYASAYRNSGYPARISKFKGKYSDDSGTISTPEIGPAFKWNNLEYSMENPGVNSKYSASLKGMNKNSKQWEELKSNVLPNESLTGIDPMVYQFLKLDFMLTDSSTTSADTLKLKSVAIDYETFPELYVAQKDFSFSPDTLLQGFSTTMNLIVRNIGKTPADTLKAKFYMNESDSAFFTSDLRLPADSAITINRVIPTSQLVSENSVKIVLSAPYPEYYTYNNTAKKSFYVQRDSVRPEFTITFDGVEILNEDIVSATPEIVITLEDNSPLPLDTTSFSLVHNNKLMSFAGDNLEYTYTPYPNSEFIIRWKPKLEDGKHTLDVYARDASNNYFDTTYSSSVFYVYNEDDLVNVLNYPNPFTDDTHFTFELRGTDSPDEFLIKIYTVAGRLIRDINVPPSDLKIGFNKIAWDGRDQDGDEIANGLYFYKVISKHNGKTRTQTQKLVKLK